MGERQSWRDLLGELTSDSIERQRIASAIGINPVTITRWVDNKSSCLTQSHSAANIFLR